MFILAQIAFWLAAGLMCLQTAYPLILALITVFVKKRQAPSEPSGNSDASQVLQVTLIVPVYKNDIHRLPEKLVNSSRLNVAPEKMEILVSGDGDFPELPKIIGNASSCFPVRFHQTGAWVGKNIALNQAVEKAAGQIIVVSDVDAALDPDVISIITQAFRNPDVGGFSGTVLVNGSKSSAAGIGSVQKKYWLFERWIKKAEMDLLGSVTSCSGQLFAVRKTLYPYLPPDVCDDIFILLSVVNQGFFFWGLPEARTFISQPSKTVSGEVERRSRIVAGGLNAIWKNRQIFFKKHSFRYGIGLFFHKVVRRLTPFLLMTIAITSLILAFSSPCWTGLFFCQISFYAVSVLSFYGVLKIRKLSFLSYFIAFNIGTSVGVFHFLTRKAKSKW